MNIFGVGVGDYLLDPFCGSGTTILEAHRLGINAVGFDLNPLAVYISRAKMLSLSIKSATILKNVKSAIVYSKKESHINYTLDLNDERIRYLLSWVPKQTLIFLEKFAKYFAKNVQKSVYLTMASNLIRAYSFQEPSDLRIRRRKTAFPDIPIEESLLLEAEQLCNNLSAYSPTRKIITDTCFYVNDIRF